MKKKSVDSRRNPDPICRHCEFATVLGGGDSCLCKKNGIVRPDDTCKKYKLDLLKISPALPLLPDTKDLNFDLL